MAVLAQYMDAWLLSQQAAHWQPPCGTHTAQATLSSDTMGQDAS